jgi:hypothetical protein
VLHSNLAVAVGEPAENEAAKRKILPIRLLRKWDRHHETSNRTGYPLNRGANRKPEDIHLYRR